MSARPHIAVFVGAFPVVSETFILRQVSGLLEGGYEVDLFADCRSPETTVQPEIARHGLMERVRFMDMPPETCPWEMPVWPLTGRTWPPGAEKPVGNAVRLARAVPLVISCWWRHRALLRSVLNPLDYGYRAESLSSLYRLHKLGSVRQKYWVLHAHFGPVANSFRFARQLWKAPLVASFHGYDFCSVPRKEGERVYEKLFAVADIVTVNSDYTRRQVEKLSCPREKIRKLPVGLRLEDFPFRSEQPGGPVRLITVGRLVEIKGHEYVIHALAELRRRGLDVCYDIVGDGPLRPALEKLARDTGLEECVVFHGAQTSGNVRRLLSEAHIFVLASVNIKGDREGQGLVVQEAQAVGLPVIVTDHGGLPEGLKSDRSGFVVPERDIGALADRLVFLASHPEVRAEMGRQGRRFVEDNYDVSSLNQRLIEIYKEASFATREYAGSV